LKCVPTQGIAAEPLREARHPGPFLRAMQRVEVLYAQRVHEYLSAVFAYVACTGFAQYVPVLGQDPRSHGDPVRREQQMVPQYGRLIADPRG
jgi:hypothetical protein